MSAVLPTARPLGNEGAALTQQQQQQKQQQQQHEQQHQHLQSSSIPASPPPLPSRNLRRTSCFLDVLLDTTKSAPTVVTATLATASAHDVYLSSEEDASSFSSDMSDYNTDEENDNDDACSSSTSTHTHASTCDDDSKSGRSGGAALHAAPSSPQRARQAASPSSSSPSAARRRSRDATARAVSVVFAGKPSLVDLGLERETRRRSVPSLRSAAAADGRRGRKDAAPAAGPLRIITEDLPSRHATASPIARPASASPYMAATTPTLTPRSSLLFRGVSRTLTLSRRLGRGGRREEARDEARDGSERNDESRQRAAVLGRSASQRTLTMASAASSSILPPPRASTPLSAMFLSASPAASAAFSDEDEQQQKRRQKTDAYADMASSSSSSSRPASAHPSSVPRSQTTSVLATPASAGPAAPARKDNAEVTSRFLGNFSGRRRSLKLL